LWHLFVFDEVKGMWHQEDNTHALDFVTADNNLYFINSDDNTLYTVNGTDESTVEWYAQTGDFGDMLPDNKYVSKLQIKMSMDAGAKVHVEMQFDSNGVWNDVCTLTAKNKQAFTLPIIPHRCDHFSVRIGGTGGCKIYSISKVIENGSEL